MSDEPTASIFCVNLSQNFTNIKLWYYINIQKCPTVFNFICCKR